MTAVWILTVMYCNSLGCREFDVGPKHENHGVYQCWQCKTVSLGSSRDLIHPKSIRDALDDLPQMDHEDSKK